MDGIVGFRRLAIDLQLRNVCVQDNINGELKGKIGPCGCHFDEVASGETKGN